MTRVLHPTLASCAAVLGLLAAAAPQTSHAAVTLAADEALVAGTNFIRRLTMRVGSNLIGTVSNVTFNVTGANVGPTPAPVTGVPSAGSAPGSAPANSVRVSVSNRWTNFAGQRVIVTVNSEAGLVCSSGPCGSTVIPFNKVSWTSSNLATGAFAGQDFGSGTFNGATNQTLVDYTAPGEPNARSFAIVNDWVFSYVNDTLYPAGVYRGRVTFTATMP